MKVCWWKLSSTSDKVSEIRQKNSDLERKVEEYDKALQEKTKQVEKLQARIGQRSDIEQQNRRLCEEKTQIRREVEKLNANQLDTESTITILRSQLKQQERRSQTEIKKLTAKNSSLEQKLRKSEALSSELEATVSNLQSQLREKGETVSQLKNAELRNQDLWNREKSVLLKKIKDLENVLREQRQDIGSQAQILQPKPLPTKFRWQ